MLDNEPAHVLVKFSGDDLSAGSTRWADLLVCEHLALQTVAQCLGIEAAPSQLYQAGGRAFLEVRQFDRHGVWGRSAVCSWAALDGALFGMAGQSWTAGAAAMRDAGMLDNQSADDIQRLWHFGQLIANTEMHEGNLPFRPGLRLAPVYDMLPMFYAPIRGVELPQREFVPFLPLPAERVLWNEAALAALQFWEQACQDTRISADFRLVCARNAENVQSLLSNPAAGLPKVSGAM